MTANLAVRHRMGLIWRLVFHVATAVAIVMLTALLLTIANRAFGLVAIRNAIEPAELSRDGVSLERMDKEMLRSVLADHVSRGLMRRFERELPFAERGRDEVYALVIERVVDPSVVQAWTLWDSLFRRPAVVEEALARYPGGAGRVPFLARRPVHQPCPVQPSRRYRGTRGDQGFAVDHPRHRAVRLSGGRRRRDLPGGVRAGYAAKPGHTDQHQQPGRGYRPSSTGCSG